MLILVALKKRLLIVKSLQNVIHDITFNLIYHVVYVTFNSTLSTVSKQKYTSFSGVLSVGAPQPCQQINGMFFFSILLKSMPKLENVCTSNKVESCLYMAI